MSPRTPTTIDSAPRRATIAACVAPALVLVLCAVPGCGGGGDDPSGGGGASDPAVASSSLRRDDRPDAVRARTLIDDGRTDLAAPLVETLAPILGMEGPLLRARIAVLEGDRAGWLAMVEEARSIDPKDPRSYATGAELYAAIGRVNAATTELQRGIEAVGSLTPEMQRAKGIIAIVTPGAGDIGLDLLEAALRADPDLPFMGRALGQAYLLAAKRAIAEDLGEMALGRLETSLEFDPEDPEARRLYGETLFRVTHEYSRGLAILENLLAEGEPITDVVGRLSWSAGFAAQANGHDEAARKHYLRARELGSIEVQRGTARTFLRALADAEFERAVEAVRDGDEDAVRLHIAEAVELAGDNGLARYAYAEDFAQRAYKALVARELDVASRFLAAAVETDPAASSIKEVSGALYFERALRAVEEGDADLAVSLAEEATKANPDDSVTLHFLGELHHARGEYAKAAPVLDRALRNAKLDGEPLSIDVQLMLAECQHLSGNVEDAVATLEQCLLSTRPQDANGREQAARYLELLGRDE